MYSVVFYAPETIRIYAQTITRRWNLGREERLALPEKHTPLTALTVTFQKSSQLSKGLLATGRRLDSQTVGTSGTEQSWTEQSNTRTSLVTAQLSCCTTHIVHSGKFRFGSSFLFARNRCDRLPLLYGNGPQAYPPRVDVFWVSPVPFGGASSVTNDIWCLSLVPFTSAARERQS